MKQLGELLLSMDLMLVVHHRVPKLKPEVTRWDNNISQDNQTGNNWEYYHALPMDGMLVHHKVNP